MVSVFLPKAKKYLFFLGDIRFWVALFFILQLENYTNPPLDAHSWRQILTITIAKNFLTIDPNIFYPRIDTAGELTGIIGSEFPIFNYILLGLYKIFGFEDWYGRVVNSLVSSFGLWALFGIFRRLVNEKVALYSTLFFGFSLYFKYARKTMPDTFALSLVFIGIYLGFRFLENPKENKILIASFLMTTLGLLSKMPAFCPLVFLIMPLLDNQFSLQSRIKLAVSTSFSTILMVIWYFIWAPHLVKTYGYQLFWAVSITEGWQILVKMSDLVWKQFMINSFGTIWSYYIALISLSIWISFKLKKLLTIFVLYTLIFLIFIIKTGEVFPTHDYYILPYIPMMSLLIGYFVGEIHIPQVLKIIIAFLLINMNYNRQRFDLKIDDNFKYRLEMGAIVDKYIGKNDKIMTNGGGYNPVCIYHAGRKGWVFHDEVLKKTNWMPDFKKNGLKYILIDKYWSNPDLPYKLIFEDQHLKIYEP